MLVTDKVMAIHKNRARYRVFSKHQLQELLDGTILQVLDGITKYKTKQGFDLTSLRSVSDIDREAPIEFKERFYLLMDILYPLKQYTELYIDRYHPEMSYMVDWLFSLYLDEAPVVKKP